MDKIRWPAALALASSGLGLVFSTNSTLDYANHLDRRLHDVHCSVIPGAERTADAEACRAAMYSPYSAFFKEQYWGGIPISLFAIGAFCALAGFALYLLIAGPRASKSSLRLFSFVNFAPLVASAVMFAISLIKLGALCQTCVGIYLSSLGLAAAGIWALWAPTPESATKEGRHEQALVFGLGLLVLGIMTVTPSLLYAAAMPDHTAYLGQCGTLKKEPIPELLELKTTSPKQPAVIFEDPLCPTCKAFHQRLVVGNMFEKLAPQLVLFPLDSECNWMLTEPLHPGACVVSRAVICGGPLARDVLEWAYSEQEALSAAGQQGEKQVLSLIERRFGPKLAGCTNSAATKRTLNKHLHYAVDNNIPVSTPQMYLGDQRFCDEDSDIGLSYTMAKLAPAVVQ